jgi:nucleoside-diphosphate-sugar epimerase
MTTPTDKEGSSMKVCVTGGAGYIGACAVEELLDAGHQVTVLDSLVHGQHAVAAGLTARGAAVIAGDVRNAAARRRALNGADAVVHLAATVGDPACAARPTHALTVNVDASRALLHDAREAGLERVVFASTCSHYGRMAATDALVDETAPLRPVSLYARQKVAIEQELPPGATALRFATVYGVAARMRFDLTVNQFTRDLWLGRPLQVFGEQFWRPYVHVRDAARAVRLALSAPEAWGRVFNVGRSDENYRKLDLVETITARLGRGDVTYVHRDEDPRDYRVDFSRIRDELGFVPWWTVPDGVDELIGALEHGHFEDPDAACYANA